MALLDCTDFLLNEDPKAVVLILLLSGCQHYHVSRIFFHLSQFVILASSQPPEYRRGIPPGNESEPLGLAPQLCRKSELRTVVSSTLPER